MGQENVYMIGTKPVTVYPGQMKYISDEVKATMRKVENDGVPEPEEFKARVPKTPLEIALERIAELEAEKAAKSEEAKAEVKEEIPVIEEKASADSEKTEIDSIVESIKANQNERKNKMQK